MRPIIDKIFIKTAGIIVLIVGAVELIGEKIYLRGHDLTRSDDPVRFWFHVTVWIGGAIYLIFFYKTERSIDNESKNEDRSDNSGGLDD